MKHMPALLVLAGLGALAACEQQQPMQLAPSVQNGWMIYAESRIHQPIPCGQMPIQLNGDRLDTHLTGDCRQVRMTGAHNVVQVDIVPGGTIEVLGSNNDVVWYQTRPGTKPQLIDRGTSNSFHRRDL